MRQWPSTLVVWTAMIHNMADAAPSWYLPDITSRTLVSADQDSRSENLFKKKSKLPLRFVKMIFIIIIFQK